uniref:Cohesin subunit SCC3/SA HEAT-repeats domain-containing protein n=1 Tax=Nothobranchius furzeri TaxID=105023 RepID=A0A8C6KDX9_NOTFU
MNVDFHKSKETNPSPSAAEGVFFHEHGAYLVDSLWAVASSELRDWETMTALLLQDAGEED